MKILTVITSAGEAGGAENAALELSRELAKHVDIEVALMGRENGERAYGGVPLREFRSKGVPIVPKPYSNVLIRTTIGGQIGRKYDLVHIHNTHPPIAMAQVARECLSQGIPYIVSTHGIVEASKVGETFALNPLFRLLKRFVVDRPLGYTLRNAQGIAALTAYETPILTNYGVREERIHLVYNGVNPVLWDGSMDLPDMREKYDIRNDIVLFVGNIKNNKGIDVLIKAAPYTSDCTVVVVGQVLHKEYHSQLLSLLASLNLEGRVVFAGRVDERELASLYFQSDIFVLPTRADTLPLTILDAMACRKPVVSTRVGGIPEEVDDETGILVEPDDHLALADAIKRLLLDKGLRKSMGEKGYNKVRQNFTWERVAEKTLKIYEQVLDNV